MTAAALAEAAEDRSYGWFFAGVRDEFAWLTDAGARVSNVLVHFRELPVEYHCLDSRVAVEYTPEPGDLRIAVVTSGQPEELIWDVMRRMDPTTDWIPWPDQNRLDRPAALSVLHLWADGMRRHLSGRRCAAIEASGGR